MMMMMMTTKHPARECLLLVDQSMHGSTDVGLRTDVVAVVEPVVAAVVVAVVQLPSNGGRESATA